LERARLAIPARRGGSLVRVSAVEDAHLSTDFETDKRMGTDFEAGEPDDPSAEGRVAGDGGAFEDASKGMYEFIHFE